MEDSQRSYANYCSNQRTVTHFRLVICTVIHKKTIYQFKNLTIAFFTVVHQAIKFLSYIKSEFAHTQFFFLCKKRYIEQFQSCKLYLRKRWCGAFQIVYFSTSLFFNFLTEHSLTKSLYCSRYTDFLILVQSSHSFYQLW